MAIYHEVESVLSRWHDAAGVADEQLFFSLMTPNAWFVGTDDSEIWDREAFQAACKKKFEKAPAWRMWHTKLDIMGVTPDKRWVWFIELLHSEGLGECRGSGVMQYVDGSYRVAQYVLSFSVPNDAIEKVKGVVLRREPA